MRMTSRVYAAVATAVVLAATGHANAQSLADRETARSLMDEADKKRDAGDMKGALKNYEAADAIMHVPTTGLEVARAHVALGHLLEAREVLGRVIRSPAKPGEPAPFTAARKAADTLNNELGGRIPSILVVVENAEAAQQPRISIDGEPIPPAAASAPRKLNPGLHVVIVQSGTFEKKLDVSLVEKENKTVTVDLSDQPPTPPPPAPTPEEPPPTAGGSSAGKVLMFSGFGVAVVGIGVGAVTGLMSLSKTNELKGICPNDVCPPGRQGEIDSAMTLGNVSTAAFIAGGIGLGAGIVGLLISPGGEKQPRDQGALLPGTRQQTRLAPRAALHEPRAAGAHVRRPASVFAPEHVRAVLGPSYVGVAGAF